MRTTHSLASAGLVLLLCLCTSGRAHEQAEALAEPGYRPGSSLSALFVSEVATTEIAVFPTIVRTPDTSGYSIASRQRVVEFLNNNGLGTGMAADIEFYMGPVEARSQYEMFLNSMETIGAQLSEYKRQVDYVMVLELLFPPVRAGTTAVFGIHCFVLAPDGTNAFSFLLNSHHKLFVDANLRTSDITAKGRERLAIKSTEVALTALKQQIQQASGSAAQTMDAAATRAIAGVIDGFESPLPSGVDVNGIPIGFFTFSDGSSEVSISTTTDHPPLPGEAVGNGVLRLDLDVSGWAGVLRNFENEDLTEWSAQDWRGFGEIRFWLYGRNSGTGLFVDILDNRNPGSKTDDAERYSFVFDDDFSGWRLITIPFTRMARKEIGNGAPLDGLGLSEVHGWAFGTLNTDGQATYYIDDFALASASSAVRGPGAGAANYPINELPMYGGRDKTASQRQADETYIQEMTRGGRSREDAANEAAQVAWNVYYRGDKSTAIKRFNQAWLLDPDNRLALWGFAATCMDRGQIEHAVRFYRMALENGPEDPRLQYEYEVATRLLEPDRSGERSGLEKGGTSAGDP